MIMNEQKKYWDGTARGSEWVMDETASPERVSDASVQPRETLTKALCQPRRTEVDSPTGYRERFCI